MNREIKFRAWDKHINTMSNPFKLEDVVKNACSLGLEGYIALPIENNIFMQYTGLKDENGKEIYEGDIVKKENELYLWKCVGEVKLSEFEVEETYEHIIHTVLGWNVDSVSLIEHEWRIIGNIYENPELLEVKNV